MFYLLLINLSFSSYTLEERCQLNEIPKSSCNLAMLLSNSRNNLIEFLPPIRSTNLINNEWCFLCEDNYDCYNECITKKDQNELIKYMKSVIKKRKRNKEVNETPKEVINTVKNIEVIKTVTVTPKEVINTVTPKEVINTVTPKEVINTVTVSNTVTASSINKTNTVTTGVRDDFEEIAKLILNKCSSPNCNKSVDKTIDKPVDKTANTFNDNKSVDKTVDRSANTFNDNKSVDRSANTNTVDSVTLTRFIDKTKVIEKPFTLYREFTTTITNSVPVINYKVTTVTNDHVVTERVTKTVEKEVTKTITKNEISYMRSTTDNNVSTVINSKIKPNTHNEFRYNESIQNESKPIQNDSFSIQKEIAPTITTNAPNKNNNKYTNNTNNDCTPNTYTNNTQNNKYSNNKAYGKQIKLKCERMKKLPKRKKRINREFLNYNSYSDTDDFYDNEEPPVSYTKPKNSIHINMNDLYQVLKNRNDNEVKTVTNTIYETRDGRVIGDNKVDKDMNDISNNNIYETRDGKVDKDINVITTTIYY